MPTNISKLLLTLWVNSWPGIIPSIPMNKPVWAINENLSKILKELLTWLKSILNIEFILSIYHIGILVLKNETTKNFVNS